MSELAIVLPVVLPLDPAGSAIDPGSGVVAGGSTQPGHVVLDFEGNRYGAVNLERFAERVLTAAHRSSSRYPTVARTVVTADAVVVIGAADLDSRTVWLFDPQDPAVVAWVGDVPTTAGTLTAAQLTVRDRLAAALPDHAEQVAHARLLE